MMGTQLPRTCREVEINILRSSVHLVGFIRKRKEKKKNTVDHQAWTCIITVKNGMERIWQKSLWDNLRHFSAMCLDRLRETVTMKCRTGGVKKTISSRHTKYVVHK